MKKSNIKVTINFVIPDSEDDLKRIEKASEILVTKILCMESEVIINEKI